MANQLYNDYKERGLLIVHVLYDNPAGGLPTWADANNWAYHQDFNSDGTVDVLDFPVIADTDRSLTAAYFKCPFTPQGQIFDQGLVTADDPCEISYPQSCLSANCGYNETYVRSVLDKLLPAKWCGEATP